MVVRKRGMRVPKHVPRPPALKGLSALRATPRGTDRASPYVRAALGTRAQRHPASARGSGLESDGIEVKEGLSVSILEPGPLVIVGADWRGAGLWCVTKWWTT